MPRVRIHPTCPVSGRTRTYMKCKCEECRKYRAEDQQRRRASTPGLTKRNNLRPYGLTLEQWQDMHDKQHGVCAVCFAPEMGVNQNGRMSLAVDHDHTTGKVRALLYHRCNRALGLLGDNPDRVQALADYRRKF